MRSYIVKENYIGPAVTSVQSDTQIYLQTSLLYTGILYRLFNYNLKEKSSNFLGKIFEFILKYFSKVVKSEAFLQLGRLELSYRFQTFNGDSC